jgi:solute carrier family 13 (sodium-dependent dicarboxylate transporter), member 2/3/5
MPVVSSPGAATSAQPSPPTGSPASPEEKGFGPAQWVGGAAGPALFVLMLLLPTPEGLSPAGWRTAAVAALMAVWWITEAMPISATALLPLVLFPLLGVGTIQVTATPYANPMIFLFMGGFIIALGMQRWGLHRRIALTIIRAIGTQPSALIAGFMVSSAFLSMWVSNTATTMMMLPIGLSVIELARSGVGVQDARAARATQGFGIALMLGIAYASSIGGIATLVGTPTNALLVGFMNETYGFQIDFVQWMMVGLPVVLVGLPVTHLVLTRVAFPIRHVKLSGSREFIDSELARLGRISGPEIMVGSVFALVGLLWIVQPLLSAWLLPGLSDAGIAIFGALILFMIPVDPKRGVFLLNWKYAEQLPWGVLILFGGGLSLAGAIQRTGLAEWIGGGFTGLSHWPVFLILLTVVAAIILLTELTSNSATAAAFLPIMASVAVGIGQNPLLLAVPIAIAASCAFMLPVATPPNAIVYGSGVMTIPQMARAGLWLNLTFTLLLAVLTYTVVVFVFGIELGTVPAWARTAG